MKKLLALLLSAAIISQSIMLNAFAEEAPQEENSAIAEEEVLPEKEERIINLPRDMRAAVITLTSFAVPCAYIINILFRYVNVAFVAY